MDTVANVILSFLGSVLILMVSIFSWRFPAKDINHLYGYRTGSSMRSQERWDFAQKCSSILMIKGSVWLLTFQLIVFMIIYFYLNYLLDAITVINAISILPMIGLVIYKTEKTLKLNFQD